MEYFRWVLIFTGAALLVVAYMMGRNRAQVRGQQTVPDVYDPSVDELSVPISDPGVDWKDDSSAGVSGAQSKTSEVSRFLTDSEIEAANESGTAGAVAFDNSNDLDPLDTPFTQDATQLANSADYDARIEADDLLDDQAFDETSSIADEFETYREPVKLEEFEEKLVTVHVVAQSNRRFYGKDLRTLFEQHGYNHGHMSLYHCSLEGDKVFSIANMVKPGTFDPDTMSTFETPGITLFMRLPIELDSDVAFDFLLREAKELASELDGHLRDENRNPLSEQTIQHMREDIQQYIFRTRRVLQSS